jgi:Ca2+-binding RTX toxin-like protein
MRSQLIGVGRVVPSFLLVLGALALPTAASAATTISRSGAAITITGDGAPSQLRHESSAYATTAAWQDDLPGAVVTPGPGCMALASNAVDCGAFVGGATVTADLGGGDDDWKDAIISYPQLISGGEGADTIETSGSNDTLSGGPGNDSLSGGLGDDVLDGGEGDDTVDGWAGNDQVTGGPGRDTLLGDGSTAYPHGNDTILARDGETDSVNCGGGADSAQVDAADVVGECVTVDRPAVVAPGAGGGGTPGTTGGPGTTTPAGPVAFSVAGSVTQTQSPSKLSKGKQITLSLTSTVTCGGQVALAITKKEAKRLKVGTKDLVLGISVPTTFSAGVATSVSVGVKTKYRKKIGKASKVSASLIVVCVDDDNKTYTGQLKATIKR